MVDRVIADPSLGLPSPCGVVPWVSILIRSHPGRQVFSTLQRQVIQHLNNFQPPAAGNQSVESLALTHGVNSVPVVAKQNCAQVRINHVTVQEAPDVIPGMFFVNATSAVVLFDSGASHSFISVAYVEKHKLPIALLKCQMIVSSPG
jgi:hypothetical protein